MIELDRDWPRLHVVAATARPHCATTPRRCGSGRRRDFCESTGSGRFVSRRSVCCWNRPPTATSSLPRMRCCSVSSTGTTNGQCGATKVSMIAYLPGRCDGSLGSSWTRRSRCGVDRRWCCGWTTDRSSYPLCCNSSAGIGSVSVRSRQGHRGTTDSSNPYTTDCGRNASTAITGRVSSKRGS